MNSFNQPNSLRFVRTRRNQAFSLAEVLMTVSVLAIITGLVLPQIGDARTGAARAKLNSDVAVLNESVKLYLAEGGSLDGITDARQVIGHLKTKGRVQDAVRHVGAITGQLVDVRLAARDLSSSEAASQKPRAVWNAATQRFGIA